MVANQLSDKIKSECIEYQAIHNSWKINLVLHKTFI
jgi:hypothetical protein